MLLQYFIAKYFSAYINGVISKKAIPTNAITINKGKAPFRHFALVE